MGLSARRPQDRLIMKALGITPQSKNPNVNTTVSRRPANMIAPIGAKVSSGQDGQSTNSIAGGFGPRPTFQTPSKSGGK